MPRALLWLLLGLALAPGTAGAAPEGMPCTPEPTVMSIAYGDVITCALDVDGDSDLFRFSGTPGTSIVIAVQGGAYPCLELIAPDNSRQTTPCGGGAARLDTVLDQTGTYSIQVTGVFAGNYVLVLERLIPSSRDRVPILYGDLVNTDLDPDGDFDLFVFGGNAGDSVSIMSNGIGCIELVAPDNSRQVDCDGVFSGRLDVVLPTSGTYAILMSGIFDGPYNLNLQCLAGPCVNLPAFCNVDAECDDGDACTTETCNPDAPGADAFGCLRALPNCDDGNVCTADGCDPGTGCTHLPISCDDGQRCTIDACTPGSGCGHVQVLGCANRVTVPLCTGQPDFTPCGAPVGTCQPTCRDDLCTSQDACARTTALPATDAPAIDVTCEASGNAQCRAQGFTVATSNDASSAVEVAVTPREKKRIKRRKGKASLRLKLNKFGKRLLDDARRAGTPLEVVVRIELISKRGDSAVLREVRFDVPSP